MEANKKRIFWLDIVFFLLLLAVGFYFFWKSAPQATAPDNGSVVTITSEVSTDLPEGVTVEDLGDGNKLVKNEKDGYEVKIMKDYYLYKDLEGKNLKVQDYIEPNQPYGGAAGCSVYFSKAEKKNRLDIKKDFQNECENIIGEDCKSVNMEDIDYNNINWIKVYLHGTFVGSDEPTYITYDGAQMYTLSFICDNQDFIDYTLNNFSF